MGKMNCWEFMKCGREFKGVRVGDLGVCPVPLEKRLDGAHEGKKAGRACWVVAGTLCQGKVQGTYAQKFTTCENCDFYRTVKREEYPKFLLAPVLINKLRNK